MYLPKNVLVYLHEFRLGINFGWYYDVSIYEHTVPSILIPENIWHCYLSLLMFIRNILLFQGIYTSFKLNLEGHRLGFITRISNKKFSISRLDESRGMENSTCYLKIKLSIKDTFAIIHSN